MINYAMVNASVEKKKIRGRFAKFLRGWLLPGIGVKRWIIIILLGTTLIGIGLGVLILDVYRNAPDTWWLPFISAISLRQLPRILRAMIFGGIGLSLVAFGIWQLNRGLMKPFLRPGESVADALRQHRQREKGPKIVAIGGGHGLATLLRGLKSFTYNLTAIVSVGDDGGSSGKIRREMGILPPGDIRNCLAALSDDEALLGQLFQYRFPEDGRFQGHSFGNLFITILAEITGSFEQAVVESGRVLAIHGEVLPSTLNDVQLQADIILPLSANELRVHGESNIPVTKGKIRRVWIEPNNPPAFPKAIQALLNADIIIIGPGSLYTSILPNLLVPDLVEAIRASRAYKMYICNIASQPGETDGFNCNDHVQVLEEYTERNILFNVIVCNNKFIGKLPEGVHWIKVDEKISAKYPVYLADLISEHNPVQHDSQKLAHVVLDLYQEKTGPLVE